MATKARYYFVTDEQKKKRLVKATSKSMAVGYVVRNSFSATVASQEELVGHLGNGGKVEDATAEATE